MTTPEVEHSTGDELVPVAQRVDGDDGVGQRRVAGQVVGGADGRGGGDPVHHRDLVGKQQTPVHDQAGVRAVRTAGHDDVDGRVPRAAGGFEQLGRGVPADHPAPLDQQVRRPRSQREVDLDVRADVHVGEQAGEPRAAEHAGSEQSGADRRGAAKGKGEIHAAQTAAEARGFRSAERA